MKAKVMVQVADRRLEMDELEVPKVGPTEGLLRVEVCGLCGSDVEQYRGGFVEKGLVKYPVIPGHEPIGIIEEIGEEARQRWKVEPGDRVALEPLITCGRCEKCLGGSQQLCKGVFQWASPSYGYLPLDVGHGLWGGYGEYIHLHERTILHKLPAELPLECATIYQALASGIRWAVDVPETRFSDTVLVLGCGQRGLGAVVALRAAGVSQIIVTGLERDAFKLQLARDLGAAHTIVADKEDTVARVMEITGNRGVDVALDVVPVDAMAVNHALESVRSGGTVVLAGIKGGTRTAAIDTDKLIYKEIRLRGVFVQGSEAYRRAIELLTREFKRLAPMHTHDVSLADVERGIQMVGGEIPGEEAICVSVHP